MNIGNLEIRSESISSYLARQPETQFTNHLSKAFRKESIEVKPTLARDIIDFSMLRQQLLIFKRRKSKRKTEADFNFRLLTIKRIIEQIKRDEDNFRSIKSDECIDSFVFVALLEKANLVFESTNETHFSDTHAIDFHLWTFRNHLIEQNIEKPAEVLAFILEKAGGLEDLKGPWNTRTVHNKCSNAQKLIDLSRRKGACHTPKRFGAWARVVSPIFVQSIAQDCENCRKVWSKLLTVNSRKVVPIDMAAKELTRTIPECASLIIKLVESLKGKGNNPMHLSEILERLPQNLKSTLPYLF